MVALQRRCSCYVFSAGAQGSGKSETLRGGRDGQQYPEGGAGRPTDRHQEDFDEPGHDRMLPRDDDLLRRPTDGRRRPHPVPTIAEAIAAVLQQARAPASIARGASDEKSDRRLGAIAPRPPIWIAIEGMFAKPHKA